VEFFQSNEAFIVLVEHFKDGFIVFEFLSRHVVYFLWDYLLLFSLVLVSWDSRSWCLYGCIIFIHIEFTHIIILLLSLQNLQTLMTSLLWPHIPQYGYFLFWIILDFFLFSQLREMNQLITSIFKRLIYLLLLWFLFFYLSKTLIPFFIMVTQGKEFILCIAFIFFQSLTDDWVFFLI
jgi:hypothetical protein